MNRVKDFFKVACTRISWLWGGPRRSIAIAGLIGLAFILAIFVGSRSVNYCGPSPPDSLFSCELFPWMLSELSYLMEMHSPWMLFTGLAAAPSLILTWYWRKKDKLEDIEIAREGQITERFTRAIELLGSDKMAAHLGAIYALERISKDSKKDHWTIVETLAAFIRESAPWLPKESEDALEKGKKPANDVQAALTVLGRRKWREDESGYIDLSYADLGGANLLGAHLEGAYLWVTNLEKANLRGAHLEGAILNFAHLERTNLFEGHLEKANLGGAHLVGVNLGLAHLEKAKLGVAHLEAAILIRAHLEEAILNDVHLYGADLRKVHLEGANLWGADLHGANLDEAKLNGAKYDKRTIFPEGFDPKAQGMILAKENEEE